LAFPAMGERVKFTIGLLSFDDAVDGRRDEEGVT
jgi:hypothetical protein